MKKVLSIFLCFVLMMQFTAFAEVTQLDSKTPTDEDYKYVDEFLKEHSDSYKNYSEDEISLHVYYADRENGIYLYRYFIKGTTGMTAQIFDKFGDYVIRFNSNYDVPAVINGEEHGGLRNMYDRGLVPDEVLEFLVSKNSGFNYDEAETAILEKLSNIGKDYFDIAEITEENTHITPYYADYEKDFYMFQVTFDEFDYDAIIRYETAGRFTFKYIGGDKRVYIIYKNEIGTAKDMYEKYKNDLYDYSWGNCNFHYDNVYRNGDVNNDGITDIVDVVLLRKAIVDNDIYNVSEYGDINFDYDIDIIDVVIIRTFIIYG